jgi:hypothetical protein
MPSVIHHRTKFKVVVAVDKFHFALYNVQLSLNC